jgi:hypothetical protein
MNRRTALLLTVLVCCVAPIGLYAASYEPLLPLLVDIAGWQAEAAEGIDLSQAGMQGVTVVREYKSGEKGFTAAITLGSMVGITWMPEYKEGFKGESDEGSMEVKRINGFLAYQAYSEGDATGGLVVLLIETTADKPGSGALLVFTFEGIPLDEGLKLAQKFDWKKLKEAAAKVK